MVDINDRRNSVGAGDFNNPKGTFSVTTHGFAETDKWSSVPHTQARADVHAYYRDQKDTKTWKEANRLAKRRTDNEFRGVQNANGAHYAEAYQGHLVRVMALKGQGIADTFGELHHRQSGYGRT